MTAFFCPRCWAVVPRTAHRCPSCEADLDQADQEEYFAKLSAALTHPDYLTRQRAAMVLGWMRDARAVGPLVAALDRESDHYVRAEIVTALRAIGGHEAEQVINRLAQDKSESIIVRKAAQVLGRRQSRESETDGR
jgi:HEAT repeat protein